MLRSVREANSESSSNADAGQERTADAPQQQSSALLGVGATQWPTDTELTADLRPVESFVVEGQRFDVSVNDHLNLVRMSEQSYRAMTGLEDRTWGAVFQGAASITAAVVTVFLGKIALPIAALSGGTDLYWVRTHGADYFEVNYPSSRVVLYDESADTVVDRIEPGKAYPLGLFFKTGNFQCDRFDDGCWLDIELSLDVQDRIDYYLDAREVQRRTGRFSPVDFSCPAGYLPEVREEGPACLRSRREPTVSLPLGRLRVEPGSHYWIIPREPIVFNAPGSAPREDETVQTFKTLQLSDTRGLFSRNSTFLVAGDDAALDVGDDYADNRLTAGEIRVNGTVTGAIEDAQDQDWFRVQLSWGRHYRIDLEGAPTGAGTLGDPYLRGVYDADGDRVGNTPNDDGGSGLNSRAHFAAPSGGVFYIAAGGYRNHEGTYTLALTSDDEYADNISTAGEIRVNGTATGTIDYPEDQDWFRVQLSSGRRYRIDIEGTPTGAGTLRDPYLRGVYDADGDLVGNTRNDDGGSGLNSRARFTAPSSGIFYIAAGGFEGNRGTYTLRIGD